MFNKNHSTPNTLPHSDRPKLLIIDDDANLCAQMKWALAQDYNVYLAEDRLSAVELVKREKPRVVLLDLGLSPRSQEVEEGFLALSEILQHDALTKVIIITGQTEKEHALKAIRQGACDFQCKPVQIHELKVILKRTFQICQLEESTAKCRAD